jgi:hypothetical protein
MRRRTKIILAVIGVAIVWPFAQIVLIAAQAQHVANGRPYCVAVAGDRFLYYWPVTSLLQMNGVTMYAPSFEGDSGSGSLQWTFHAVLLVDTGSTPEWRNWSYRHQHFDRLTPQQAKAMRLYEPECEPQPDYVLKLPLFAKP